MEGEGEAEEEVSEVRRGRKKGREGQNERRPLTKTMTTGRAKFPKEKKNTKKRDTCHVHENTTLKVSPGPSHDLVKDEELAKARSKEGKRKVKKVGPGGILKPVCQTSSAGPRYYACPYEPCEETVVSIEGMRSHIKWVHALYSYSCSYCHFTTKSFDSLK